MEELIEKAKNGDKEAFTTLALSLQKDLYKIAKIRLKNDDDVYDAIQETLVIAFQSIRKLKKIEYFKTWIIRILINESNHIYKKRRSEKVISFGDIENSNFILSDDLKNTDILLDFNFICNKLKYEDRIVIILYYLHNFTDKEIGKILNLNENTIKTRRKRAKQKIQNILEMGGKNEWMN